MIQFYVLALVFMLYGAAVLLADEYGEKVNILLRIKETYSINQTFSIVLIVLTAVVGILKLISPTSPGPVVIGDFLPAINLIALAVFFTFDLARKQKKSDDEHGNVSENDDVFADSDPISKVQSFYYKNKKILGFATLGIALFHFLFPGAVLL
ncbi:MAG: hypothetical protein HQ557_07645 [Bacteroidetes bacterium]|nr:hypothetical protein [Bacteroidota bacterium]